MTTTLAVFPLTAHLLKNGRMRLRIFEPRYTRMVKEACAGERKFAMAMLDTTTEHVSVLPIVTIADVIDFEQLPDGMLGITVAGREKALIEEQWLESDGLRIANVSTLNDWPASPCTSEDECPLAENLQVVFNEYPELGELYADVDWQDESWICQRWLEILPIKAQLKQQFLQDDDHSSAMQYLRNMIIDPPSSESRIED